MKTDNDCLVTLETRIEYASKVITLFKEQLVTNSSVAFMLMGKDALHAAAYIKVFNDIADALEEGSADRQELHALYQQRIIQRSVSQGFKTANMLESMTFQAETSAMGEALEILAD